MIKNDKKIEIKRNIKDVNVQKPFHPYPMSIVVVIKKEQAQTNPISRFRTLLGMTTRGCSVDWPRGSWYGQTMRSLGNPIQN